MLNCFFLSCTRLVLLLAICGLLGCPAPEPEADPAASAAVPAPTRMLKAGLLSELNNEAPVLITLGEAEFWAIRKTDARGAEYPLLLGTICPRDRCAVTYSEQANAYACTCGGCRFDAEGRRTAGPAQADLPLVYYEIKDGEVLVDPKRELPRH